MALAMHGYQGEHGRLPPAVVYGRDGKPLHSWRVLLLPFIEQEKLYKEFKLEEPWDSPHNIQLLPKMPLTYSPPPGRMKMIPAYHTIVHVFVGKGAAFEGNERLHFKDFSDGTSNTILMIEAGKPVPWTKPEELPYDPHLPLPELKGFFKDILRAGMADGSSRWIGKNVSEKTFRAAITRNGGEELGMDWQR